MPAWFNALWPVAVFFLGQASTYLTGFITERRQIARETKARQAERDKLLIERRETFELDHLERLNNALHRLGREAARAHQHDMMTARRTGEYGSEPLGDEYDAAFLEANREVYMLRHVVLDDHIRASVATAHLALNAPSSMPQPSMDEAQSMFGEAIAHVEAAHAAIGERIREIYLSAAQPRTGRPHQRFYFFTSGA